MTVQPGGLASADPPSRQRIETTDLEHLLADWVASGLLTTEQASRILAKECGGQHPEAHRGTRHTPALPSRPGATATSLVVEGLGYVGGVLVLVAAGVLAGQYFDDLGRAGRLLVAALASLGLVAGGALVTAPARRPAAGRLRSVLWALAVGTSALFLGLLADETLHWRGVDVTLLSASGAAVVGLSLWPRHRWFLQQAVVFVALAVALGSAAAGHLGHGDIALPGVAVWGLGGVWLLLGWGRHLGPRYATDLLGGAALSIGAQMTAVHDWGMALALATAAGLVLAGVRLGALVVLGVGAVTTLSVVPGAMQRYFPDSPAGPIALLVAGLVLVASAVLTSRRLGHRAAGVGRPRGSRVRRPEAAVTGTGWPTITGFAAVVAIVLAVLGRG